MPERQSTVSALITCEHAGNEVPGRWGFLFEGQAEVLNSHRGFDRGSLELGVALADRLRAPLLTGTVTRLLVDLNRPARHPRHFSEFTRDLAPTERERIDVEYWKPHWERYGECLQRLPGRIVHIACHSFVPVLGGRVRGADIGLLYDPSRARERAWCHSLAKQIRAILPDLKVRMNYPYRGTSNGMGQQHRAHFSDERLITMELEINQSLCDRRDWPELLGKLSRATEWVLQAEIEP